jgi:hypothetical protein
VYKIQQHGHYRNWFSLNMNTGSSWINTHVLSRNRIYGPRPISSPIWHSPFVVPYRSSYGYSAHSGTSSASTNPISSDVGYEDVIDVESEGLGWQVDLRHEREGFTKANTLVPEWIAQVVMTDVGVLGSCCPQRFRHHKVRDIIDRLLVFLVLGVDFTLWVNMVGRDVSEFCFFRKCAQRDEVWGSVWVCVGVFG